MHGQAFISLALRIGRHVDIFLAGYRTTPWKAAGCAA